VRQAIAEIGDPISSSKDNLVDVLRWHRRCLLEFSERLLSLRDVPAIAQSASRAACDLVGVRFGAVALLDGERQRFVPQGCAGWDASCRLQAVRSEVDTEWGYAARLGGMVLIPDLQSETRFQVPAAYSAAGVVTGAIVPLVEHGEVIGVIAVHHDRPHAWAEEDCDALQLLANVTGNAIRHCHHKQRAERTAEDQVRTARELRIKSAALDGTADMIVITDLHGQVEYVNPAFERNTGYPRDEAVGTRFCFMKSEAVAPDIYHDIWETLFAGQPWRGIVVNDRKDGTDYLEEQTITPVVGEDGEIQHFVAIKRMLSVAKR
jgi:PAS domain S-box-containing protein